MESVLGSFLATRLPKSLDGWVLEDICGEGRSAVVYRAQKATGENAAVKVFDPALVSRYGAAVQLKRIEREKSLIGLRHPNLVQILGGGQDEGSGLLYVVMEYIDSPNLASCLQAVPRGRIWELTAQVARAARFLEELSLVHRDIKPENIAISPDFERAVLLDLGVLRPVGAGGPPITDEAHRFFLGTLQYSSPELLMRREVDNRDGWRAVTFYQLGAVLHDFIMRRRIFADFEDPYPALADAIHNTKPVISANDVPGDLVVLAQNCLMKKPAMRLEYVTWESFEPGVESPSEDATIERIRRRTAADQEGNTLGSAHREQSAARTLQTVVRDIQDLIRQQCMSTGVFPPMRMQAEFDGTTTKAAVFVLFSKSRAAAMKQNLIVGFNIGLDDASDMAIRVTASACLSKSDAGFGKVLVSCEDEPLFGGAFDASTFAKAVKGMMLDLLERAQTQAPATGVSVLRGKMRPS